MAQTDAAGNHPGGVIPMVGSTLKPEVGLSTTEDGACFTPSGQQCIAATYTPVDVHRAGNADSSTCLYSRYIYCVSKNGHPFCFCYNFVYCQPICI